MALLRANPTVRIGPSLAFRRMDFGCRRLEMFARNEDLSLTNFSTKDTTDENRRDSVVTPLG
jgi:hypothetical protein